MKYLLPLAALLVTIGIILAISFRADEQIAFGASTSATNPGTVVNDTGIGTRSWSNASNATTCNGTFARSLSISDAQTSNYLASSNYGFALPTGATITGIQTSIEIQSLNSNNRFPDLNTRITKGGVIQTGTTVSLIDEQVNTTPSTKTFGGPTEMYGTTLTEADVEASNFGLAFYISEGNSDQYEVDCFSMTVHYTTPVSADVMSDTIIFE